MQRERTEGVPTGYAPAMRVCGLASANREQKTDRDMVPSIADPIVIATTGYHKKQGKHHEPADSQLLIKLAWIVATPRRQINLCHKMTRLHGIADPPPLRND